MEPWEQEIEALKAQIQELKDRPDTTQATADLLASIQTKIAELESRPLTDPTAVLDAMQVRLDTIQAKLDAQPAPTAPPPSPPPPPPPSVVVVPLVPATPEPPAPQTGKRGREFL